MANNIIKTATNKTPNKLKLTFIYNKPKEKTMITDKEK